MITSPIKKKNNKEVEIIRDVSKYDTSDLAIQTGKTMIKSWAKSLPDSERTSYAQNFMIRLIEEYWQNTQSSFTRKRRLPLLFKKIEFKELDNSIIAVAHAIGASAAKLSVTESSFLLGSIYTMVLPESTRNASGVFYTPPALADRLIELSEKAGINWANSRILDPACGGGAFLAPVCLKMLEALKGRKPKFILNHIQTHLSGWEIDSFAGWLSQVFVEISLKDLLAVTDFKFLPIVTICNSIEENRNHKECYDLVIGNPPYGKLKLTNEVRTQFGESLFGHPNLYGIFTHLAFQRAGDSGIVAFLTPTSFLSGEYFKKLRQFIRFNASILEIDFVSTRKGVFEGVLQETMLAVYRKGRNESVVEVNECTTRKDQKICVEKIGHFSLDTKLSSPWILPRTKDDSYEVSIMYKHKYRLSDWGYKVSTGPLVWNRHKSQLIANSEKISYPIVWAESIRFNGSFALKSEKSNHRPYFKFKEGDEWLLNKKPCILLQRTTAKEQSKRLIAAALPETLRLAGVIVENHLNMIIPKDENPLVSASVLSVFLNSKVVNRAFRSISGSVAVSAYELESLPLPDAKSLFLINDLLSQNVTDEELESACEAIYNLRNETHTIYNKKAGTRTTNANFS